MTDGRYPGYDVLRKRHSPSWNEQTRMVIDARLAIPRDPRFFTAVEWETLVAICDRIVPQPRDAPPVPLAAFVDAKMFTQRRDGHRTPSMPKQEDAWRRGLAALDAEAATLRARRFHLLGADDQDLLLKRMQDGDLHDPAWGGMPPAAFFSSRVLTDIVSSFYSHPTSWNRIGFGGPASPRGYVRMDFDRRDPWEAVEATPGLPSDAERLNKRVR